MQQQIKDLMNKALDLIWFDPKNADNPSSVVVLISPNDWKIFEYEGRTMMFPDKMAAENWYYVGSRLAENIELRAMTVYEYMLECPEVLPDATVWWEVWYTTVDHRNEGTQYLDYMSAERNYNELTKIAGMTNVRMIKMELVHQVDL